MNEIILSKRKNGMGMLILICLLYLVSIVLFIGAASNALPIRGALRGVIMAFSVIWFCIGWFLYLGLKVIRPQEALVLTLFGNYVGTLKEEGFYWVNPFCVAVNPAAKTRLSQSGDVDSGEGRSLLTTLATNGKQTGEMTSRSLLLSGFPRNCRTG